MTKDNAEKQPTTAELIERLKVTGERKVTYDELTHAALAALLERVEAIAAKLGV